MSVSLPTTWTCDVIHSGNIHILPVWKKGATAEEFLLELAAMARAQPGWFEKLVVVRVSGSDDRIETYYRGCGAIERQGILHLAAWREAQFALGEDSE